MLAEYIEEVDIFACRDREGASAVSKFHRVDRLAKINLVNLRERSKIPPADFAILCCADTNSSSLSFVPNDASDHSLTRETIWVAAKNEGLSICAVQVEEADLLLVTASQEVLRLGLGVESD